MDEGVFEISGFYRGYFILYDVIVLLGSVVLKMPLSYISFNPFTFDTNNPNPKPYSNPAYSLA